MTTLNALKNNTAHKASAVRGTGLLLVVLGFLAGCSIIGPKAPEPSATAIDDIDYTYLIGPGDNLSIFVWRNPDLSSSVTVRPDGKVSTPLVDDLLAAGKTPSDLAREVEEVLSEYIRDPLVTISVSGFVGEYYEQVRVVGEAANPLSIPYRRSMTLLDLMIATGGLTEFAAGNRATLVRTLDGEQTEYRVRLEDLIRDGDISANRQVQPGDILIIPEAFF